MLRKFPKGLSQETQAGFFTYVDDTWIEWKLRGFIMFFLPSNPIFGLII